MWIDRKTARDRERAKEREIGRASIDRKTARKGERDRDSV